MKSKNKYLAHAFLLPLFFTTTLPSCMKQKSHSENKELKSNFRGPNEDIVRKITSLPPLDPPTSPFTTEIFSRNFDVKKHMDLPTESSSDNDSSYALNGAPVPIGVLSEVRIITAFNGQIRSMYAAEQMGIEFLKLTRKVKVAHNVYALYWAETGTASTATAGASAATVAAGAVAVTGAVVVGYMVYDIYSNQKKVEELSKNFSKEEKKDIWDGTNSYWSNFCRIYGIGC